MTAADRAAPQIRPLFDDAFLDGLRQVLRTGFSTAQVNRTLGIRGQAAMSRHDLDGVARVIGVGGQTETLIRLFLLGRPVPPDHAAAALEPLTVGSAVTAGLITLDAATGEVSAALELRPYTEDGGPDWWVVSDLGRGVRPGRLQPEHVLGPGAAATTLAQATIRRPMRRALDVGTGCGVQALHLSRHCDEVVATDLSERALRFAATTAELSGQQWTLLQGSLLQPVADQRFDLIVCNPPFIVGPGFAPGSDGYRYRDSGLAGDEVCARLVGGLPGRLADGGTAQLLANWVIGSGQAWQDRLAGWLPERGCRAWIWQREVAEVGEYAALWLRDAGELPGTDRWRARYTHWLDWFAANDVAAVGMGLISIRRTGDDASDVVCEDVPQAHALPIGATIDSWFARAEWLHRVDEAALLSARLTAATDLVRTSHDVLGEHGWQHSVMHVRQANGMRWDLEVDQTIAGLVAACTGEVPLGVLLELLAPAVGLSAEQLSTAVLPVVRDLIGRGFLVPEAV